MNCSHCNNPITPDAAFCGTCGQPLGQPAAHGQPAAPLAPMPTTMTTVAAPMHTAGNAHVNPQAIAALVFGVLGCAGWLIPIFGVLLGILAIIFGTIGLKSQKRKLAITGIVLAIPVIAFSLFVWIEAAKQLGQDQQSITSTQAGGDDALQTITTPCYSTRLPSVLTISQNSNSCDFKATNTAAGELYQVKVMDAPDLSADNLAIAAKADVDNVVSIISGASINSEWDSGFVGSPAYAFTLGAADGSAGTIKYIYHSSGSGDLVIVFHSQRSGTKHDLATIENSWYWR